MQRAILLVFLLCLSGIAQAESDSTVSEGLPVISEIGAVEKTGSFGGLAIDIGSGNRSNSTGDVSSDSWPVIAEVYTATWCDNCLDSEAAVSDVANTHSIERLHYHRYYSEIQDPFGTEVGDDRWINRFGPTNARATDGLERLPPAVVFNGEWLHSGSVARGEGTLIDDYESSVVLGSSLPLNDLSASLTWSPDDGTNGTVNWAISENIDSITMPDIRGDDCPDFDSPSIRPILYVVEEIARYENGSNGLENYPHIIRDIHHLQLEGPTSITLPEIWDGEDFRLVLVFDWEMQYGEYECNQEEAGFLPASGVFSSLFVLTFVSVALRKK
tara:strand:+ start:242 stop:1228 length:987 start_codon:yes stop_codon:yes gene_type:complete